MTFKLVAIAVLGVLMLTVLFLNRRAARKPPRAGRPLHGRSGSRRADAADGSDAINSALIVAIGADAHHRHHGEDHGSPAPHAPDTSHHGGFDAGGHGGGFDGGGAH